MREFVDFARANGVLIPRLKADGAIHRVPTVAHPQSTNGAYKFTGDWGWVQSWEEHDAPILYKAEGARAAIVARDMRAIREQERKTRQAAAIAARSVLEHCELAPHPYLARKGFPAEMVLVHADGRMVVPMRDVADYRRVNSVQWIDADGDKKFLTGGAARGSIFKLGSGGETWLCEGYATALSVRAALADLYRPVTVVVCFSAGNLGPVARALTGRVFVAADNDDSGTGARFAAATGLPWVMPEAVGTDFNDLHQAHGVRTVAKRLREARIA